MRAAQMKERPNFSLMKQDDVQSIYYMQMPRWLFSDPRYADMSLDAKVTYTFLLNRFQLSRRKGWVNDQGEVFVIFPRKELAKELRICEKRVTAAFRKLVELELVWEKRCGRGEANQIYLAVVNPRSDPGYSCAPFLPPDAESGDSRTADLEVLDSETGKDVLEESPPSVPGGSPRPDAGALVSHAASGLDTESASDAGTSLSGTGRTAPTAPDATIPDYPCLGRTLSKPASPYAASVPDASARGTSTPSSLRASAQEPQNRRFQNGGFGGSRAADLAVAEPPNRRSSKKDISNTYGSEKEVSLSVSAAHDWTAPRHDGQADGEEELQAILDACNLELFEPEVALVLENAIERLYYSQSLRVGNAVLPQARVRSRLNLLNAIVLREAESKLASNLDRKVKNSTAYTMSTIYNCIAECEGDLLVDPYLNSLRGPGKEGAPCY